MPYTKHAYYVGSCAVYDHIITHLFGRLCDDILILTLLFKVPGPDWLRQNYLEQWWNSRLHYTGWSRPFWTSRLCLVRPPLTNKSRQSSCHDHSCFDWKSDAQIVTNSLLAGLGTIWSTCTTGGPGTRSFECFEIGWPNLCMELSVSWPWSAGVPALFGLRPGQSQTGLDVETMLKLCCNCFLTLQNCLKFFCTLNHINRIRSVPWEFEND